MAAELIKLQNDCRFIP